MRSDMPVSTSLKSSGSSHGFVRLAIRASVGLALACGFDASGRAGDLTAQPQNAPLPRKAAPAGPVSSGWAGFYFGGHVGYVKADSNWSSTPGMGTAALTGTIDIYDNDGPWGPMIGGLQTGYNYVFPSHLMLGVETDFSFPDHIAGTQRLSPTAADQFNVEDELEFFGTARARVGFVSDKWLIYATGGFAFARDLMIRTQLVGTPNAAAATPGSEDQQLITRLGWTAGLGTEFKMSQNWGIKFDYLFMDFGSKNVAFPLGGDHYGSDLFVQTVRAGLNYHFGGTPGQPASFGDATPDMTNWNVHGQTTWIAQGYPAFHAPYSGQQSLTPNGEVRETVSATGFVGFGLWDGAALYYDPELIQGLGLSGTKGLGGFSNGEAQKAGFLYPRYNTARLYFQQVFGLGGGQEKIEDGPNQIAGKVDVSRFTVTVGKMAVTDFFDSNSYAHDPRGDFMNWTIYEAGAFDYAANRVGYDWGAVGELNQKTWAVRGGYFLVPTVPNGDDFDTAFFRRGQYLVELEERYSLFSQPGKLRLGSWVTSAFAGSFAATLADPALDLDISQTRRTRIEYGFYANLEQAVTDDVGVFARASWRNGQSEVIAFTDADRSYSAGGVLKGTAWGRPDDKVGMAGVINGLSGEYRAFLAAGGLGINIGDGRLNYTEEKILEAYYAYGIDKRSTFTVDYQFVADPAYNADRGPVSIFSGRYHAEF
jgi:high affinity Mn2+ porin